MAVIKPSIIFSLLFCLFFTACIKESADEQDPEITIFQSGEEAETVFLAAGEVTSFQARISDESNVHSFKTSLSFDEDTSVYICQLESNWSLIEITEGEAGVDFYDIHIQTPDSVKGFYDLEFEAFDEFGNLASTSRDVIILNSNQTNFIELSMDSIVESCSFYSDEMAIPELIVEAETNALFSEVNFYSVSNSNFNLINSLSTPSVDYLNSNFQLYSSVPESNLDTILIELRTTDDISIWSEFVLQNQ